LPVRCLFIACSLLVCGEGWQRAAPVKCLNSVVVRGAPMEVDERVGCARFPGRERWVCLGKGPRTTGRPLPDSCGWWLESLFRTCSPTVRGFRFQYSRFLDTRCSGSTGREHYIYGVLLSERARGHSLHARLGACLAFRARHEICLFPNSNPRTVGVQHLFPACSVRVRPPAGEPSAGRWRRRSMDGCEAGGRAGRRARGLSWLRDLFPAC
jgi:hypothetical protein